MRLMSYALLAAAVAAAGSSSRPPPPMGQRMPLEVAMRYQSGVDDRQRQRQRQRNLQTGGSNESAASALRSQLLSNYDRGSYPWSTLWEGKNESEIREGLNVGLDVNFHKVFSVDIAKSVIDLVVWVRQTWNDPRLVWNPSDYDGLQTMWFWIQDGSGAGGETSEIWTPDLELWNLEEPLSSTLVDTYALVSANGDVYWSRPGHIKPVCKFKGLNEFPFDSLSCTMEIGSWSYSGLYLRPVLANGIGYSLGGSETAGEAFAEYSLANVGAELHIYPPYPVAPSEDWPVIFYHVTFQRAWQPYVRGYLVLQIVLNLCAFCSFWLPAHIGERMGLNITALLAAVASELVIAANLPLASEITWFAKFSLGSLAFASLSLFESAAVIYFYFKTGPDLVPDWAKWMRRKLHVILKNKKEKNSDKDSVENANGTSLEYEHDGPQEEETRLDSVQEHEIPSSPKNDRKTPRTQKISERRSMTDFHRKLSMSTRQGIKTVLGRDADDFKNAEEMQNNIRWQKLAADIDNFSRVAFPLAFAIFLGSTLSGTV